VKFLGFVLDTYHGVFRLTAQQKLKLQQAITSGLNQKSNVPAKLLARVTGLLASMSLVTGAVSGLFSRSLHKVLNSRILWRSTVALDDRALEELSFRQQSLESFSSKSFWPSGSLTCVLHYDAGADGWGSHLTIDGVEHRTHGAWEAHERHGVKSSTRRELEGLSRLLVSMVHLLKDCRVTARGDAMNVYFLLERGGSSAEHLQDICLRIFWFCRKHRIQLAPEWIPRELNQLADYLSKVKEIDDFGLQPSVFEFVAKQFGPFSVDRFASSRNALLPRFFSEFRSPGSVGVNAFTESWHHGPSYWSPPPPVGHEDTSACKGVSGRACPGSVRLAWSDLVASACWLWGPNLGPVCEAVFAAA
jgi:hypothetical protein